MDFTNFWFPKKAQDGEYTIDQSLRFRNNGTATSYLENSSLNFLGDQTYTLSYWLKKATGSNQNLMNIDPFNNDTSAGGTPGAGVHHAANGGLSMYSGSGFARGYPGDPLFRDHSAWYHFVHSRDATGWQTWVNGVSLGTVEVSDLDGAGGTKIMNPWGGGQAQYGAYLADYYCIDGQYLSPTVFGEYNADGVWAPIKPNFAKGVVRYSDDVTTDTGGYYSSTTGPEKMFDGQFGGTNPHYTQSDSSSGSSWIEWNPSTPVPYTSSVEVYCGGPTVNFNDGPDQTVPPTTWTEVASGSGEITKIKFTGGYGGTVHAIRVDGVILTDPYLWSSAITTAATNTYYSGTAQNIFDGDISTNTGVSDVSSGGDPGVQASYIYFNPTVGIPFNDKVEVWTHPTTTSNFTFNGGAQITAPANQWVEIASGGGTINNITCINTIPNNSTAWWSALRVDGSILVDGANPSFGSNGFHLDFSDPNDVGADRSGNGNHFTASGIDTSLVANGYWVDDTCTFSNGTIPNSNGQSYIIDADPANGPVGYSCPSNSFTGLFDGKLDTNGMYWPSVPETGGNEFTFDLRDYDTIESFDFYTYNWSPSGIPDHRVEFLDSNKVAIPGTERSTGGLTTEPQAMDWRSMTVLGDPKYIRFFRTSTSDHLQMRAFRINGAILDQSGTPDITYDVMSDTPTKNFATLNPIANDDIQPQALFTNANLQATGVTTSISSSGYTSIQIRLDDPNTYYFESYIDDADASTYPAMYFNKSTRPGPNEAYNLYFYQQKNGVIVFGDGRGNDAGVSWSAGDILGITVNPTADTVTLTVNGVTSNSVNLQSIDTDEYIVFNLNIAGTNSATFNAGQQPFVHQPEYTVALQTQNLPEPTIQNGRDQFQCITNGPGTGTSYAEGEINISAPFVADPAKEVAWRDSSLINYVGVVTLDAGAVYNPLYVWSASTNSGLQIYTSEDGQTWTDTGVTSQNGGATFYFNGPARYIRFGNGGGTWQGDYFQGVGTIDILGLAQQAFPNGMWWIKERTNSDHHQLLDSVRGGEFVLQPDSAGSETSYVTPSTECVAWCWKAGENTVTNNGGTIESQVCVNEESGFSIVQWVGDGNFGSVGHGLGKRPGLVITKTRQGDHWIVGMDGITVLDGGGPPEAWVNTDSFVTTNWQNAFIWNDSGAQSTYYASSGINVSGNTMIAYVWAPIPGYSSFGTYIGHNNSDQVNNGSFVYCGFRPAFILTKCVTAGSDWIIVDTTRELTNPTQQYLRVNQTDQESTMTGQGFDILSNGFKIQQGGSFIGDAGQTYLYWAFAENPFQSPTTAR